MRRLAIVGALLLVAAVTALAARERARPAPRHVLIVGGVEDAAKWGDPSGNMALARRAGFRVIVLSSIWRRPLWAPGAVELDSLRGAIDAADAAGIRPIVAVYSFSSETPLSARDRAQFASYAAAIARAIPELRYISLGNEPNSDLFWMPQFGPDGSDAAAAAYFKLLELGLPDRQAGRPARHGDRRLARRARQRQPAARPPRRTRRAGSSRTSARPSGRAVSRSRRSTCSRSTPTRRTPRSPRPRPTRTRPRSGSPTTRGSCSC